MEVTPTHRLHAWGDSLVNLSYRYVTISVEVPREVKERLERAGVRPSKVAKEAITRKLLRSGSRSLSRGPRS